MNLKEYKNKRSTMILEAENLIEANKVEEANAKMEEIANLDAKFEEEGKANANLNALRNKTIDDFVDFTGKGNSVIDSTIEKSKNIEDDALNTLDYRNAFMNYVVKGEKSNELTALNATGPSKSTDVGILIPTEISQKIIKKLENSGNILALVNRTNVPGGIEIPVEKLKPVATWVAEGAGSDKQKKDYGKVIFGYHKLRCAVSVTLEVANLTLASFEFNLVENIADAMIKALEEAIINGDGSGKPKGILKEEANEGQALEVTAIELKTLLDAEAAIPEEYEETAEWCMSKKTFMQFIGITDSNGQLVARVDHGIDGKITRYLLGRRVHITKHVDSFSSTLGATKIFAFIFNFKDYTLNTAFNMGIRKYIDEETDDEVTKTAMLVDGKVTNKDSLVILKKAVIPSMLKVEVEATEETESTTEEEGVKDVSSTSRRKKYLRIDADYTEEDEFITALIESAEEMLKNQTGLTSIQLESSRLSAIYVYKYVAELFESRGSTEQASLKTQNVLDNIVAQLAMCNDYRVK